MTARPLQLFNSLTRDLEAFEPLDPSNVRIYSCGPTVYNYAHLGNLRAYVFVDTLRRSLMWKGYGLTHVMNITDVGHLTSDADEGEDKMERAAERERKTVWDIAAHYTEAFERDLTRLNVLEPSIWCKATDHIQEMIDFTRDIEQGGYTYALEDGLYFDTAKVPDYGYLGRLDLEGLEEGKRVSGPDGKRHPSDFAVWRRSPEDAQRLMEWHSPWGVGAPGWHLECSVMSMKYLGRQFDIHTGGVDHRQVHHCNEIAQNQAFCRSESTGARYWMHNEFLVVRDRKMAKSEGGFLTLSTVLDNGIHPLAYRLFTLTAAYRSQLEFSWDALVAARAQLRRLLLRIAELKAKAGSTEWLGTLAEAKYSKGASLSYLRAEIEGPLSKAAQSWIDKLDAAVSDDLATPRALADLGELVETKQLAPEERLRLVASYDMVLGLELLTLEASELSVRPKAAAIGEAEIEAAIAERLEARKAKDFAAADALRDALLAKGVALMDGPEGTTWAWEPLITEQA